MIESILLHLLANSVTAALLAVAVWIFTRVVRNAPLAHFLWLVVLVKLVVPAPSPIAVLHWQASVAAKTTQEPPQFAEAISVGELVDGEHTSETSITRLSQPDPPAKRWSWPSWSVLLASIWITGSLGWFVLVAVRVRRFNRLIALTELAPEDWQREAESLAGRLGLAHCPPIRLTSSRLPPLLWSMFRRPMIVLPRELTEQIPGDQRSMLLAHELAHLRRRDTLTRHFELVVLGLYWWHPAAWLACRELRAAEEVCCDAWVAWLWPNANRRYAELLVQTVDFLAISPPLPAGASGFASIRPLKRRFKMLLENRSPRRLPRWGMGLLVVAALPVLGVCLTAAEVEKPPTKADVIPRLESAPPAAVPSAATSPDSAAAYDLDETLLTRVSCDVTNRPLRELLDQIRQAAAPPEFVFDIPTMGDIAVTLVAREVTRRSALNLALRSCGLAYYVKDRETAVSGHSQQAMIRIVAAHERDAANFLIRKYYVADLQSSPWRQAIGEKGGNAPLIDKIKSKIQPESWIIRSFEGNYVNEAADHRYLEIRNTPEVHEQVADLLNTLRGQMTGRRTADRLVNQVRAKASFNFPGTPMAEALQEIAAAYDVNIHFDPRVAARFGAPPDMVVTWDEMVVRWDDKDVTLGEALARTLGPKKLVYVLEDEVLKIRRAQIVTMIYDVSDLVITESSPPDSPDFDALIQKIRARTSHLDWDGPGSIGNGSISRYLKNLSLVISQTDIGHAEIAKLLAEMRASKRKEAGDRVSHYQSRY